MKLAFNKQSSFIISNICHFCKKKTNIIKCPETFYIFDDNRAILYYYKMRNFYFEKNFFATKMDRFSVCWLTIRSKCSI